MRPIALRVSAEFRAGCSVEIAARAGAVAKTATLAVHARDHWICAYCGFRSERYQTVVDTAENTRDVDALVTACIFCQQCVRLESVTTMRSGLIVWLPELAQVTIHHLARDLYRARLVDDAYGHRARRILQTIAAKDAEPRKGAAQRLGTDDPARLAEMLRDDTALGEAIAPNGRWDGARLFPLDRRIIREDDLEFNEFPQILAYWRSTRGPLNRPEYPALERAERLLAVQLMPDELAGDEPAGTPHAVLAAKLLRDAAAFFDTLAEQNHTLEGQMRENASVFRDVAKLVEGEPLARLGGSLHTLHESQFGGSRELTSATAAAKLLRDAATFFRGLAAENTRLAEQMVANARVFDQVAELVAGNPLGRLR